MPHFLMSPTSVGWHANLQEVKSNVPDIILWVSTSMASSCQKPLFYVSSIDVMYPCILLSLHADNDDCIGNPCPGNQGCADGVNAYTCA